MSEEERSDSGGHEFTGRWAPPHAKAADMFSGSHQARKVLTRRAATVFGCTFIVGMAAIVALGVAAHSVLVVAVFTLFWTMLVSGALSTYGVLRRRD